MRPGRPSFLGAAQVPTSRSRRVRRILVLALAALLAGSACGRKAKIAAPPPARQAPRAPATTPQPPPRPAAQGATGPAQAPARNPEPVQQEMPDPRAPAISDPSTAQEFAAGPSIRIGLSVTASEIAVTSEGSYLFQEKSPEAARESISGDVQIRVERGTESQVFRIQVASLASADSADDLKQKLEGQFSLPVVVRDSGTGTRQVRLGAFATREEAREFASEKLDDAGYPGGFVVRETSSIGNGEPRLALRGPDRLFRVHKSGFLFFPVSRESSLRFDGKPYRGLLDVSLNKNGRLTVVNQLPMEDYLPGVVPVEISPSTYPAPAALAAQAIAARTFALRNMGKFKADGFDLSNDVRSQVYGGVAAERPMTNDAVRLTAGLALYYDNVPIDAMYTSTCGGRTEDFENVFDSRPVPYLRSVACSEESGDARSIGDILEGGHDTDQVVTGHDGALLNSELGLARVLEWTSGSGSAYLSSPPSVNEIRRWAGLARRLSRANGEPATGEDLAEVLTIAGFLRYAAEQVFGPEEIARRTTDRDTDYYLGNLKDGGTVPALARRPLAYLLQNDHWHPHPDNTVRPGEPISRSTAVALLVRWTKAVRPDLLRTGVLSSARDGLEIRSGNRTQSFRIAGQLRLFKRTGNTAAPVESLRIIGNERVRFHLSREGAIDFAEVELSPGGASSDRFSPVATWQASLSRSDISSRLRPLAPAVGEILDLRPAKTGNSGRAVRIEVLGARGSAVLNGYRVRGALGLRDTLFTISRVLDSEGAIETFQFSGRGWGHGIGLCQVGAYGMARAGRTYEEILKAYYQGVELRRAY